MSLTTNNYILIVLKVNIKCDDKMAVQLVEHLQESGIPTEGLNCFSMTEAPLSWGEAVPIWYLQQALNKVNQGMKQINQRQFHVYGVHDIRVWY